MIGLDFQAGRRSLHPLARELADRRLIRPRLTAPFKAFLSPARQDRVLASPMENVSSKHDEDSPAPRLFPSTHWSVVMCAGLDSSETAREAFGQLYRAYQGPLLAFLRRCGHTDDQARELAQGFFESLLQRSGLSTVERTGRFRNWLLVCLKRHLSDLRDKERAIKRGGGQTPVPIGPDGEEHMVDPPTTGRTPDQEFDRQFALRFLEQVMERLAGEYHSRGKSALFDRLQPLLLDKKGGRSQAEIARELGLTEGHVNQEVSRLRSRYRKLFDQQLEQLVGEKSELADEKRFLLDALRTG